MDITGIAKSHHAGIQKASSRKEWKLSDSLREQIAGYAREDAAQGVYMGNKFLALRKSEVAKVAPDRAALMGKVDMKTIREADERWLCLLYIKQNLEGVWLYEKMELFIHGTCSCTIRHYVFCSCL